MIDIPDKKETHQAEKEPDERKMEIQDKKVRVLLDEVLDDQKKEAEGQKDKIFYN